MDNIFSLIKQDKAVATLMGNMRRPKFSTLAYGLTGSQKHVIMAAGMLNRTVVILCHDHQQLVDWKADLSYLLPTMPLMELPELDIVSVQNTTSSLELMSSRMRTLYSLLQAEPVIVLAKAAAAVQKVMPAQEFSRYCLQLKVGDIKDKDELLQQLVARGYSSALEIETAGQFSSRGGIVDIFPINRDNPVRVEFFDDEICSLREFSLESRKSAQQLLEFSIIPVCRPGRGSSSACFLEYLPKNGLVIFDEPMRIREQIRKLVKESPEVKKLILTWEGLAAAAKGCTAVYAVLLLQQLHDVELQEMLDFTVTEMTPFRRQMDIMADSAGSWLRNKWRVEVLLADFSKAEGLREFFAKHRLPAMVCQDAEDRGGGICIRQGSLLNGFELPGAQLAVVTEQDIFGHQKRRTPIRASRDEKITHFRDINPGDYVVHVSYGIGKYMGVKTIDLGEGQHRDYLYIKYAGEEKLFMSAEQLNQLQKYIGNEGEAPKLSKMGGAEWKRTRRRAQKAAEDIAEKLLTLYAQRQKAQGFAFSPDTLDQQEFEDAFPYEETPDQLQAIADIKRDMELPRPMERLLCGDVGFGKTEVAIRAAYKAAMDGKQVAVLVPTTVLAQQHFQTFQQRFKDFPPVIDVICRFRTAREQRETLQKLKAGLVDILIGTHAILNSNRVQFKNLGLLIVDEEQRFGVRQKEKIKTLSAGIDVLSLSATPIPRTLHMSLTGTRDLSIIETPPGDRFPVQTYVVENNDDIIATAIRRELKRGGQIYFIYNRVDTIGKMLARLQALVPEARIQVAHGQMPEETLERVMVDFYEKSYDILLATTIVENGLDVANANTIIVYNADRFGLSQLYQMRGRVGRSSRLAFAYFVYQADKVLTETAEKRLQAMKEFAELGMGFKIAMRDLEIRGAGNLLGSEQHGNIAGVGFEMYCQLLEDAVAKLKGELPPAPEAPEPVIDLKADAYIDNGYLEDAMHKIEIYKRIAAIRTSNEVKELNDELTDRFGKPSTPVHNLLVVALIRNYARNLGVKALSEKPAALDITLLPKAHIQQANILKLKNMLQKLMTMYPQQDLIRLKLLPQYKSNILKFTLWILKLLSGEKIQNNQNKKSKK